MEACGDIADNVCHLRGENYDGRDPYGLCRGRLYRHCDARHTVLLALANGSKFGVRRAMIGMAGAVLSDVVLLGAQAVRMLRKSGALWLDRICGGALLTLAAYLALYRRASA